MNNTGHGQADDELKKVIGKEHLISHADVDLYIWEKYQEHPHEKPILLLAHGSSTAGRESFDLRVPGKPSYSLMDALAAEGFDIFALDVRGFGRSTKPAGHLTTQQASNDLNAVVDYIIGLRGVPKVHLLGWSWGTQYAGLFVMTYPEKVERFISYAQMHLDSPDIAARRANAAVFSSTPYMQIAESDWKTRFFSMTPEAVNDVEVIEAYARAATTVQTKTPTGPQLDMLMLLPMIHARLIRVPTMLIHGEYDDVADTAGLFPFFHLLPNPDKRYVVIPEAGHMMHLQQGHERFITEVSHFFRIPS